MKQEDKELLLKDLCARLPYGVKCLVNFNDGTKDIMTLKTGLPNSFGKWDFYNKNYSVCSDNFKACLRPMSSMTKEERNEYHSYCDYYYGTYFDTVGSIDWLNAHHFDYRGLIEKGLAIEAPEEIYKDHEKE